MFNCPKTWKLSEISGCLMLIRGISFPKSAKKYDYKNGLLACLRTANVQRDVDWSNLWFVDNSFLKREEQIIEKGDILISVSNSLKLLGKVSLIKNIPYLSTIGAFIVNLRVPKLLNNKFIFYYFSSLDFKNKVREKASTTTNISNISVGKLGKIFIPIAPLNEQNRIVEKVEELFSDLDKATEDLKKTQEQLKIYRQAVLKAAFEGKLTEEWRQTRKEASNVKHTTLNNICIKAEKIKNDENSERLIKYLDIGSINNKVFKIVSHKTYKIKNAPSRAKQIVKEGDTLFSTVRTYLKNIACVYLEYDNEICSTGFCVIRPKKGVLLSKYIFYYVYYF